MTAHTVGTAAIRVVVSRPDGAHTVGEQTRLKAAGLVIVDVQSTPGAASRHLAPDGWRRVSLTIDHNLSNDDLACAYIHGRPAPRSGGAARELSELHACRGAASRARTSAVAENAERPTCPRPVLCHRGRASYWDADISETLAVARRDDDPEVRLDGLIAEMTADPAKAVGHLQLARDSETDQVRRERLVSSSRSPCGPRAARRPRRATGPGSATRPTVRSRFRSSPWLGRRLHRSARRIAEVVDRRTVVDGWEVLKLRTSISMPRLPTPPAAQHQFGLPVLCRHRPCRRHDRHRARHQFSFRCI